MSRRPGGSSSPRLRIPVHVAAYSVLFSPALLLGWYYQRNYYENEDQSKALESELQEKYGDDIGRAKARNAHMANFLQKTMQGNQVDAAMDEQLSQVLHGGKNDMKRHYRVDERYYGTAEGVAEKQRREQERQQQKEARKQKRKPLLASSNSGTDITTDAETSTTAAVTAISTTDHHGRSESSLINSLVKVVGDSFRRVDVPQVGMVSVVAVAAAAVGYWLGGGKGGGSKSQ